jgi:hypothetical protein
MKQRIVLSTLLALVASHALADTPSYQMMMFSKGILPSAGTTPPPGGGTGPTPTPTPTPTPPPALKGFVSTSPTSLSFSAQQTGTNSAPAVLTVTNTGPGPLTFSNLFVGTGTSDYSASNNCSTLAPGAQCAVTVVFHPSNGGTRPGGLVLSHNGDGGGGVSLYGIGQYPSASLSTPTFAPTGVGGSTTAAATLTNTGTGPLTISGVATTGPEFSVVSSTCAASLPAGASCTASVRFTPATNAAAAGTLSVDTNAGTKTVTLGSTGIQGFASVNPSSLTFAAQQVASTSASKIVTVTNTGNHTLTFTGVGISTGSSHFSQSNTCGAVEVGSSCFVAVSFTPSANGERTGTLSFTHNGGGIANVALTGTGEDSTASLAAPAFNATTMVGTNSTASAALTNTGIGALTLTPPTAASVSGTDFSFVSTTCTSTLAPGATCTTSVRFSPTATTARTGELVIETGAGNQTASLSATGTPSALTASVNNLSFAALPTLTQTKQITLTNTSATSATVSSLALTGTAAGKYTASGCLTAVPAGGTCTVDVTFAPGTDAAAGQAATLTITHSAMNGPQTVTLSGSSTYSAAGPTFPSGASLATFSGQTVSWNAGASYGGFTVGNSFRSSGKFTLGYTSTAASLAALQYAIQDTSGGYYALDWASGTVVKAGTFTGGAANGTAFTRPTLANGDTITAAVDFGTRSITWRKCNASNACTTLHSASGLTTSTMRLYIWKGAAGAASVTIQSSGVAAGSLGGYHNGYPD